MFVLRLVTVSALVFATWSEDMNDLRFVKDDFVDLDVSTSFNKSSLPGSFSVRVEKPDGVFQVKTNISRPSRSPTRRPLFKLPMFLFGQKFTTNFSVIQDIMKIKWHPTKNSSDNVEVHPHKLIKGVSVEPPAAKRKKSLNLPWPRPDRPTKLVTNQSQNQNEKDCQLKNFYDFSYAFDANWGAAKTPEDTGLSEFDILNHFMTLLKALAQHPALDLEKICLSEKVKDLTIK